jgi:hypothetical protein
MVQNVYQARKCEEMVQNAGWVKEVVQNTDQLRKDGEVTEYKLGLARRRDGA